MVRHNVICSFRVHLSVSGSTFPPSKTISSNLDPHFFFLMIRRPPRSTLFPYTRSSDLVVTVPAAVRFSRSQVIFGAAKYGSRMTRSEEHTSELQSRSDLVCRLLLEK